MHTKLACLAVAITFCAGCGSGTPASPGAPSPTPVSTSPSGLAGAWIGTFDITSCSGGSYGCVPSPESFILRLGADGAGVLQIRSRVWGSSQPPIAVTVSVQSSTAAETVLAGASGEAAKNLQVQLRLTESSSTLQGSVHYEIDDTLAGPRVVNDGRILFATRDTMVTLAPFQGDWLGYVARTQCSGDCDQDPIVTGNGGTQLSLSHVGADVSGTINNWLKVTGTARGNSLTASVHLTVAADACRPGWDSRTYCVVDATLNATVDSLERLHGSIEYHVEGVSQYGRNFALDGKANLDGLVRWP